MGRVVEFQSADSLREFFEKHTLFVAVPQSPLWSNVVAVIPNFVPLHKGCGVTCQIINTQRRAQHGNDSCYVRVTVVNYISARAEINEGIPVLFDGKRSWYRVEEVGQLFAAHFELFDLDSAFLPLLEDEFDDHSEDEDEEPETTRTCEDQQKVCSPPPENQIGSG